MQLRTRAPTQPNCFRKPKNLTHYSLYAHRMDKSPHDHDDGFVPHTTTTTVLFHFLIHCGYSHGMAVHSQYGQITTHAKLRVATPSSPCADATSIIANTDKNKDNNINNNINNITSWTNHNKSKHTQYDPMNRSLGRFPCAIWSSTDHVVQAFCPDEKANKQITGCTSSEYMFLR